MPATRHQRRAWETGAPDPDGWAPGGVEPQSEYHDEGSQIPPARDRDGALYEESLEDGSGEWHPAVKRVASRYIAMQWTPERRLTDALTKGDTFLTHLNYLAREAPYAKRYIEKAIKYVEIALQIAGRDIARELGLPSVRYASLRTASMVRTAGEVRFIKDRGGDKNEWGWGSPGPAERQMSADFKFKPAHLKPLASSLRASLAALGHTMSAYQTFAKIKSAKVSPDGALGGKGYIAKIADMRRQYMNVVEALSALTDTLYDEVNAPHWNPAVEEQSPREREEVQEIMDDAEEIREDPEGWAEEEEGDMDTDKRGKTARVLRQSLQRVSNLDQMRVKRVAFRHLRRSLA